MENERENILTNVIKFDDLFGKPIYDFCRIISFNFPIPYFVSVITGCKKNVNGFWMISLHKPLNDCVVDVDVDVYCAAVATVATGARVRLMLICHAGLRIPL